MRQEMINAQLSAKKLAVFQITTDLHSDTPRWTTLSFLPEHLVLAEPSQYIALTSISRVWVSNGLPDQVTCVAYKDKQGRSQTLVMRIQGGQGEHFKEIYRHIHTSEMKSESLQPDTTPMWVRGIVSRLNDRKRKALI